MSIQLIGIVGAGQMGAGIAQVAAQSGYKVVVVDAEETALEKGKKRIQGSLEKFVQKQQVSQEQMNEALERMDFSIHFSRLEEAVVEKEEIKKEVFKKISQVVSGPTILASNTSSISITRLATVTRFPERFIGMHFMNPVPLMQLVELIRGHQTSQETFLATQALAHSFKKTTTVSKDYPGFIANRILMPMINEAFYALMEGLASAEDIDATMKLGTHHPMGPLQLADFIGLDTCLAIMQVLHEGFGDGKYRPCPLLKQYVDAGYLGKKSGKGIYSYGV